MSRPHVFCTVSGLNKVILNFECDYFVEVVSLPLSDFAPSA